MDHRTKVDWLGGRTRAEPSEVVDALRVAYGSAGQFLNTVATGRGWMGYETMLTVRLADMPLGWLAFGGQFQRDWTHLSITGKGCDWVQDWNTAEDALDTLKAWEPRRVDIALDTFKGETGHDAICAAYEAGRFTTTGRKPAMQTVEHADPLSGDTVYIGKRTNEKFLRCYEKGLKEAQGEEFVAGVRAADWYRVELELKAADRQLPEDVIARRDQYFAGAYPYLQTLLADVDPALLVNLRTAGPQTDLQQKLAACRRQYGSILFTAMHAYEGDISAVWQRIVGDRHSAELLEAGVLLTPH